MGSLLKWLYCCLDDFVAFHAEVCDKVLGQFLICVNMLVEIWGRAMLDILHSRIEGLPERRVTFNALFHHVGESFLLQYPLVRVVFERSTSEVR
jgi:hypothetical protein